MPKLLGKEANPERISLLEKLLNKSKKMMETYFLNDRKYICGNEISIADLQAMCEFSQFWVLDVNPCEDHPTIARWMNNVETALQPHFDEVHKMVYMARDKGIFKAKL